MKIHFADHGSQGYYKPFATRPLVLVSLLLITLTLIALTEYACRTIPNHTGIGALGNVMNGTLKRDLKSNIKRAPVKNVERLESFIPILSNPLLFGLLTSTSSSSTSPSVTSTATGGNLSLGSGSTSLPGKGGPITTSIATGGWLSTGDGSTTADPPSQPTPPSQPSSVNSPASNPVSQPTSPPIVAGGNDPPSDPNTPVNAAPSSIPANPVQQPTNIDTPEGGPAGTSAPPAFTEPALGGVTLAESLADPVTDSNAAPTPVVVVSDGQTFAETPTPASVASDGSPLPVVVTSDGQVFTQTPNAAPLPVVFTSDGRIFTESQNGNPTPVIVVSDGQTFTQAPNANPAPSVFVSDGKTFTETPSPDAIPNGTPTPVTFVSDGRTFTETPTPVEFVSDGKTYTTTPTPVIFVSDGHTFTSTPTPNNDLQTPSISPLIYISNGHTFTSTPNPTASATEIALKPVATIVNSTGTYLLWSTGASSIYPQITLSQYTLVAFVPLLLSVLYTIPFRILDRAIREMEPFYQLHQPAGALTEHSLCLDYTTSNAFITPFKAGIRGHTFMFWSSMMSLAVVGLAPLSSEALFVSLSGVYGADVTVHEQDYASWGVYPVLARLIEGLLSFVAVLIVFMLWAGRRRESGVYGEPLSIVGLATLFHSSPILRGFREIDSMVTNSELKKILRGQRFRVGEFVTANYRACWGLLPADSEAGVLVNGNAERKGPYRLVEGAESREKIGSETMSCEMRKEKSQRWEMMREKLLYTGILVLVTGMLTLICYYHWSEGDIHHGFEGFMDSSGFGVRFMMTALGVVLKMFWSNLDQDLRRIAPYTRLANSPTHPLDSILIPTYSSPFSAIIPSLRRHHFLTAHIALLSILSEFLPICLANITFSAATTQTAYETCNDISLIILILMFLSIIVLIAKPRRGKKRLPRDPSTLASVLVYLAAQGGRGKEREGLLDSLKGMERMGTRERNEVVRGWGRAYALGEDKGGGVRVDEVERIERLWVD